MRQAEQDPWVARPKVRGQTMHSGLCARRRRVPLTDSTRECFSVVMTVFISSRCDLHDVRKQDVHNQK